MGDILEKGKENMENDDYQQKDQRIAELYAIEQLEKVKNYMITDEKDMFGANYLMNSGYVLEFIDNQINELKGKVEKCMRRK